MQNPNHNDDDDLLTLSLSCNRPKRARNSPPSNPPPQTMHTQMQIPFPNPMFVPYPSASNHNSMQQEEYRFNVRVNALAPAVSRRRSRRRRHRSQSEKSETVPPPFPWATDRRATVHSRKYLLENNIVSITGILECKRCKNEFEMVLDLESKFSELWNFIRREKESMHDRAPEAWMNPVLPQCQHCGKENSAQPFLAGTKKRAINWLFLLLGQMIGCCTLDHLKYFLKHSNIHRTGSKDHLLYSTYIGLCNQLVPEWFDLS
ncbi:hypothetical protein GLYMA_13G210200v4 [Glycine max]|uniref:DUF7086 domain-containing protein n=2 Tax=Glycine subgen. Soja TaxID=1462606 RepID=I1M162_SOYBN|nr:uncharacterized protein LOC102663049 [Glycine max]XP_028186589.1 uncharacterized protein LOC114373290 [Glycine soja]KAG4960180.1 hypothetical protein JHK87_036813 [Glycine soja]KRH20927.1 hypothetical protein GLYMA_13G210200v4 [Glycine max]RZB82086.1 hypothetical protein D0Y65_031338 [Glycine soja]|eukprot:XP_006595392.1 uncharacterized protein LOC102663049 [Glycine max]